jgi:hypothetical protein
MTTAKDSMLQNGRQQFFVSARLRQSPLKQLAIIAIAAAMLIVSSCARLSGTFQNHNLSLKNETVLFYVGLVAIPFAIVGAAIALIMRFGRKRGMRA